MLTRSISPLLGLLHRCKTIPIVESRAQFAQIFEAPHILAILLKHCNLFEMNTMLEQAHKRGLAVYVYIDHVDGIHDDAAGLRYLAHQFHVAGIASNHPKTLALAKSFRLETIQRIFAADSTGLEMALESVDQSNTDLLDISPALAIPYIISSLSEPLPLPFIGSGLIQTTQQLQQILRANASGVAVARSALWREQYKEYQK